MIRLSINSGNMRTLVLGMTFFVAESEGISQWSPVTFEEKPVPCNALWARLSAAYIACEQYKEYGQVKKDIVGAQRYGKKYAPACEKLYDTLCNMGVFEDKTLTLRINGLFYMLKLAQDEEWVARTQKSNNGSELYRRQVLRETEQKAAQEGLESLVKAESPEDKRRFFDLTQENKKSSFDWEQKKEKEAFERELEEELKKQKEAEEPKKQ